MIKLYAEKKCVMFGGICLSENAESSSVEIWLWLLMVMSPYNPKTTLILSQFGFDPAAAAKAIRDGKIPYLTEAERRRAAEIRSGAVHNVLNVCEENNVQIIALDDERYPTLLKNIDNPPIVLFCAGNIGCLNSEFTVSAVGTRNASTYGYKVTKTLIYSLAKLGAVITSGLAVGLDSEAHRACLDAGGKTVGVCGCGIMVDYPKGSGALKRRIIENGGALISELLPFQKPFGGYFQHRNRIISGVSLGTIILEAGERSGCLLTAQHALEQGRDVFAVPPHSILEARYSGTAALIRDGAIPVFNYIDIVRMLLKEGSLRDYFKKALGETK